MLERPVDLAWRDGDEGRYVVEQGGRVVRLAAGQEPAAVLDITDLTEAQGERGLLGLAFAPDGALAYVNYTDGNGDTVVAEYAVDEAGRFDAASVRVVLQIDQPYANHNGGDLAFGPDGLLYVGMGDGGAGGDPERRALDLGSLLGKLLRIDPVASAEGPYTVPDDNPFVDTADAAPEVWAQGLRNPWRFSFDRATGDLWIADVGQGAFEEVDVAPAVDGVDAGRGLSFGWSAFEGDAPFNADAPAEGHTPPIHTYPHENGECSISGGVRPRDSGVPALDGWYVFADYCSGRLAALEVIGSGDQITAGRVLELGRVESPTAVVDGPTGELYVLSAAGPVLLLTAP
ncbi:MAG: PQQ-dependent sugar dehydrogenase [Acidimicrobiia bacterium]|nr:PQQ-dependent sugar dehydrogenase [Acidimicrobiia bacterium]